MVRKIDAKSMPVQVNPCTTCPFAGTEPIQLNANRLREVYQKVMTLQTSHLCHTADDTKLCRGGRDLQIRVAYALGYIDEPTDEAFQSALEQFGRSPTENDCEQP